MRKIPSSWPLFLMMRKKRHELKQQHGIENTFTYTEYDQCLSSGVDAVYIAVPNHLHKEYAVRAARAGVNVLCEKPMAVNEAECREMMEAAEQAGVKVDGRLPAAL